MIVKSSLINIYLFSAFIFGTCIFLYGFFPLSYSSTRISDLSDIPRDFDNISLTDDFYKIRYARAVLMIIDAMRIDFITSQDSMNYVKTLLKTNDACLYQIKVHPPTVTLPRLEALTSGTIPSFFDVVLNFGSSEMKTDSFIKQMHLQNRKMVFYGDNTWTKLFPQEFDRRGETKDSFFVNDFYEGDRNITKNLRIELRNHDWELMVLHFLGLDHIGHVEGPYSSKIPKKLEEMDIIVRDIHSTLNNWNEASLIFVTGDHGMRDSGGHGGNSYSETHIPFLFIRSNCTKTEETYEQADLATTISILLGLPIPHSSIGSIIPELISEFRNEDQLSILYYSTSRLFKKIANIFEKDMLQHKEFYKQYQNGIDLHKKYLNELRNINKTNTGYYSRAQHLYVLSSREMTSILTQNFSQFDLFLICTGIIFNIFVFITFLINFYSNIHENFINFNVNIKNFVCMLIVVTVVKYFICKLTDCHSVLCGFNILSNGIIISIGCFIYFNSKIILYKFEIWKDDHLKNIFKNRTYIEVFILFSLIFHTFSYASSSFIEEEHQTWHYITKTLFIIFFLMEFKLIVSTQFILEDYLNYNELIYLKHILNKNRLFFLKWVFLFGAHIFLRRLNQTGDKWLFLPDIGDWLILPENKMWMSLFFGLGLILMICACCDYAGILTNILVFTATILIYYYRTITESVLFMGIKPSTSKTSLAIFWLNIIEIIVINYANVLYKILFKKQTLTPKEIKSWLGSNVVIFCVVSSLLHKPYNVILNGACIMTCDVINRLCNNLIRKNDLKKNIFKIIMHIWIGKLFFFYQGNSNSLASIDLNAGYVGLDSYNIVCVGLFLTINTYSGIILSFFVLLFNVYDSDKPNATPSSSSSNTSLVIPITMLTILTPFVLYLIIITTFRHHIFVWTVFSPKIFYDFYHMCLMFVILMLIYLMQKIN